MWWFREVIAMWQCVCDLNGYCGSVFGTRDRFRFLNL